MEQLKLALKIDKNQYCGKKTRKTNIKLESQCLLISNLRKRCRMGI